MTSSAVAAATRITVISAELRADLAVPTAATIAELLMTLVGSLGPEAADSGAAAGGWVLQRPGDAALDPASTLAGARIRDGEVLHLRTRSEALPEIAFDDVLDAVGTAITRRTARWQPGHTAAAAVLSGVAAAGLAVGVIVTSGPRWLEPAVTSGIGAAIALILAAGLARGFARPGAATTAGVLAVGLGGVSGGTALGGHHHLAQFGAPQALLAVGAAVLTAVLALLATGVGIPVFTAVISAGIAAAVGSGAATITTLRPAGTAALVAAVALAASPVLPMLSFRLARLPLPAVPGRAEDLARESGPPDSKALLRQAVAADDYLTGLVTGLGAALVVAAGALALTAPHDGSARALIVVLGLICLLRARLFTGRTQRSALLAAGLLCLAAVLVDVAASAAPTTRLLAVAVPLLAAAVALLAGSAALPGRAWTPPWSRAADLIESGLVLSVVPLALAIMGVYGAIRVGVNS